MSLINDFKLRFGVYLPTYLPTGRASSLLDLNLQTVLTIEKEGLDSAWVCDHLCGVHSISEKTGSRTPDILETWTTIAALAAQTKDIIYGTCVLCIPYRNPAVVAKMAANMDHITGGKFILGVGAGWRREEFEAYGFQWEPFSKRYERTREAIEIIKRMWTQRTVNFEGKFHTIRCGELWPKPLQKPRPPIWLGAAGPKMTTLINETDGYVPALLTPQLYEQQARLVRSLIGNRRIHMGLECYTSIAKNPDKAKEQCAEFVKQWFGQPLESLLKRGNQKSDSRIGIIVGGPDECIEGIDQYIKAGVNHFILHFMPMTATVVGLNLYSKHVVPYFRETYSTH